MKKAYILLLILLSCCLAACEENSNSSSPTDGNDLVNEGNAEVNEKDRGIEDSTGENNDPNQQTNVVHETHYSTEKEAINSIENYYEVEQTNIDLGHGLKGFAEGAAGHHYISWNEGKWLIEINFPTDPVYAIDNYDSADVLAKEIVNYLEDHYLPPPDERGKIQINGFREHPETFIQWQEGNTVYEIKQNTPDPLETLQIAVDYAKK